MNRNAQLLVTAVVFGAGAAGAAFVTSQVVSPADRTLAAWAYVAPDAQALYEYADVVVVAQATATQPSRVVDTEGHRLPFEVTDFQVLQRVKGPLPGPSVSVERTGGLDPATGEYLDVGVDGGPFDAGAQYLLFLKLQPSTGLYFQINDQSRFALVQGRLQAVEEEDVVAEQLDGLTLLEALDRLR